MGNNETSLSQCGLGGSAVFARPLPVNRAIITQLLPSSPRCSCPRVSRSQAAWALALRPPPVGSSRKRHSRHREHSQQLGYSHRRLDAQSARLPCMQLREACTVPYSTCAWCLAGGQTCPVLPQAREGVQAPTSSLSKSPSAMRRLRLLIAAPPSA